MKIHFSQSYYNDTGSSSVLDAIEKTRYELENAYAGFNNAIDPDLIDCYIFEVNSLLKRYRFLLHQAEEMKLISAARNGQNNHSELEISLIPVMQNGLFALSENEGRSNRKERDPLYEESPSGTLTV